MLIMIYDDVYVDIGVSVDVGVGVGFDVDVDVDDSCNDTNDDLPAYFGSKYKYVKLIIRHDLIDILSVCHDIHSIQSYMVMTII